MGFSIDHIALLVAVCISLLAFYLWIINLIATIKGVRSEVFSPKLILRCIGIFVPIIGVVMGLVRA